MWNLKQKKTKTKKNVKLIETESKKVVARGWGSGQGNRERLINRYKLWAVRGIRSEDLMYDMVTVVGNNVLQNWNLLKVEGFPPGSVVKNRLAKAGGPWVGRMPWKRKWEPTPVSLPGKSHGQRSLADCSPWGCKRVRQTSCLNNRESRI